MEPITEKNFENILNALHDPQLPLNEKDGAEECFKLAQMLHTQLIQEAGEDLDRDKICDAIQEGEFDQNDRLQYFFNPSKATDSVVAVITPTISKLKQQLREQKQLWIDSQSEIAQMIQSFRKNNESSKIVIENLTDGFVINLDEKDKQIESLFQALDEIDSMCVNAGASEGGMITTPKRLHKIVKEAISKYSASKQPKDQAI